MPGAVTTKTILDGTAASVTMRVWDESAAGTGPFSFFTVLGADGAKLAKAEDATANSGDEGIMALAVRADTAAATGSNGDYVPLLTDGTGRLWTHVGAIEAGTNLIGKVKTKFFAASGTALTRPANTTAYTANDAVSDNATAGSVTAKSITVSDVNDDTVTIDRFRLDSTDTGIAGKSVRVWLYNSDPTASSGVSGGDNSAFSNKKAGFIGTLSGTFRTFSDGSAAVLVPDEGARIVTTPTSGARTIYWQLQALEAFTPSANSTTFTPTAEGFQGAA